MGFVCGILKDKWGAAPVSHINILEMSDKYVNSSSKFHHFSIDFKF